LSCHESWLPAAKTAKAAQRSYGLPITTTTQQQQQQQEAGGGVFELYCGICENPSANRV